MSIVDIESSTSICRAQATATTGPQSQAIRGHTQLSHGALLIRYRNVTNRIIGMPEAYRRARNAEASAAQGYSKRSYEVFDLVLRADMQVTSQPTLKHIQELETLVDCHERLRALEL